MKLPSSARRAAVCAGVVSLATLAFAPFASTSQAAAPLPANLARFADCPISNPRTASCIVIATKDAKLKVGTTNLNTTSPLTLSFGLKYDPETGQESVIPPNNGSPTLRAPRIPIPGGLTGIPGSGIGPLAAYATPQLVADPVINIAALFQGTPTAIQLKLRAKVENPFTDLASIIGSGCYLGSASNPLTLELVTGTTAPPPPNTPITGYPGDPTVEGLPIGGVKYADVRAVDNSYRAPGATGCGFLGSLNWAINLKAGVPAPAGKNSANLLTDVYLMDANVVREALGLPPVY